MTEHEEESLRERRAEADAGVRERKAGHTAGPWEQGDNALLGLGASRIIYAVALATDPSGDDAPAIASFRRHPFGQEEAEANARLACAAPDLLAACRLAHAALDAATSTLAIESAFGTGLDDLYEQVRTAREACGAALGRTEGGE